MRLENKVHLSEETLRFIIENYTYEAGVRKLKENLFEIISEINLKLPSKNKLNYQERKKYNNRLAWIKKRFNVIENEMNKEKSTIQNPKYVDNYEILQKANILTRRAQRAGKLMI